MTVKEYLKQLELIDIIIKQKIEEQKGLKIKEISLERISGDDETGCFTELRRKIRATEELISHEIGEYLDRKRKIIKSIQQLKNPNHVQLMFKKYVEYKSLEDISEEMCYTYQYMREMHAQAIKELGKVLKANDAG